MPDDIDPVVFGEIKATVSYLKEQTSVTHRRIDKLDGKLVNLYERVDESHADIMHKLEDIHRVQNHRGGFVKGMWRTIVVIGAVVTGVAASVSGAISCMMQM